jgi:hypothetical protein
MRVWLRCCAVRTLFASLSHRPHADLTPEQAAELTAAADTVRRTGAPRGGRSRVRCGGGADAGVPTQRWAHDLIDLSAPRAAAGDAPGAPGAAAGAAAGARAGVAAGGVPWQPPELMFGAQTARLPQRARCRMHAGHCACAQTLPEPPRRASAQTFLNCTRSG